MHQDRLAQLISRKLSGEATLLERQELEQLLQLHPEEQYFAEIISEYWLNTGKAVQDETRQNDEHFRHILEVAEKEEDFTDITKGGSIIGSANLRKFVIAASILSFIVVSAWLIYSMSRNKITLDQKREVVAKSGARSRMMLPDGTTVWLNSESKISYAFNSNDSLREVFLEGEGFFDVIKNPHRPFIVHTGTIDIRVLGTAFDVKSYPKEKTIETTLIRGLIRVTKGDLQDGPALIIHPHEKLVINKNETNGSNDPNGNNSNANGWGWTAKEMIVKKVPVDVADNEMKETAWIYNKLVFDGDSFKEISVQLERWFNVKFIFSDPDLEKYRFHVKFENESIEQVMTALQLSTPFIYKINNNEIKIFKREL